jgi:hypothetical protein
MAAAGPTHVIRICDRSNAGNDALPCSMQYSRQCMSKAGVEGVRTCRECTVYTVFSTSCVPQEAFGAKGVNTCKPIGALRAVRAGSLELTHQCLPCLKCTCCTMSMPSGQLIVPQFIRHPHGHLHQATHVSSIALLALLITHRNSAAGDPAKQGATCDCSCAPVPMSCCHVLDAKLTYELISKLQGVGQDTQAPRCHRRHPRNTTPSRTQAGVTSCA